MPRLPLMMALMRPMKGECTMAKYYILIFRKAKNGATVKKHIFGDPDIDQTTKVAVDYVRHHYKTATAVFVANEENHEHTTKYL